MDTSEDTTTTMEPDDKDKEYTPTYTYDYNSGMVSQTLAAGLSAADMGFYVASKSTSVGVGIARGLICTTVS
jgi:hypothetical protein